MYQEIKKADWFTIAGGSYGRIGVGWTPSISSVSGRRLNLNRMGSIGGRMEEQDYLEIGLAFKVRPAKLTRDSTEINIQFRAAVYTRGAAYFGNSSTSSVDGLTFVLPELYVEGKNVLTKGLNIWVGNRLYRGNDVHIADYFYFNDHSGQGFGIEYKNNRASVNFVSSTDTTATVPPYFYLNYLSGTPSLEIRNRIVYSYEHDLHFGKYSLVTFLGEFHRIGDPSDNPGTANDLFSFPGDYGWVVGAKYQHENLTYGILKPGSFNQLAVRYGSGIANGGDGGSSRTWETFGAVDTVDFKFRDAYSWHIVNHFLLNFSTKFSLNGYVVYNYSRGAAESSGEATTYLGRTVYNQKKDFTFGLQGLNYITDVFHWRTELHYSQRRQGLDPWYRVFKLSFVPTLALRGERSVWSRPHIRFVYSIARFNDAAQNDQFSPYLQLTGPKEWGHYFGIRAEWWTW
ncbi:carbohydrate porin [Marinigracilibium pacificum]|uniref:Carbohydrate porin n=1 Tax=Marinigracilibium pacificum TaxID=2729599 RepID=A0A848J3U3_9BACT|nr:carbohydrate porin [Marinigracilibium pacificum]NMM50396.1 carbohydrate porin [Marinigracilibium pacificum]